MVARPIAGPVRVIGVGVDAAVVDDELEGIVHESAVATLVVGIVTLHEFLLR